MKKYYTIKELEILKQDNIILLCKKKIYNVTDFINLHPGPSNIIIKNIDKDNTLNYNFHSKKAKKIWDTFLIGYLKC